VELVAEERAELHLDRQTSTNDKHNAGAQEEHDYPEQWKVPASVFDLIYGPMRYSLEKRRTRTMAPD